MNVAYRGLYYRTMPPSQVKIIVLDKLNSRSALPFLSCPSTKTMSKGKKDFKTWEHKRRSILYTTFVFLVPITVLFSNALVIPLTLSYPYYTL